MESKKNKFAIVARPVKNSARPFIVKNVSWNLVIWSIILKNWNRQRTLSVTVELKKVGKTVGNVQLDYNRDSKIRLQFQIWCYYSKSTSSYFIYFWSTFSSCAKTDSKIFLENIMSRFPKISIFFYFEKCQA